MHRRLHLSSGGPLKKSPFSPHEFFHIQSFWSSQYHVVLKSILGAGDYKKNLAWACASDIRSMLFLPVLPLLITQDTLRHLFYSSSITGARMICFPAFKYSAPPMRIEGREAVDFFYGLIAPVIHARTRKYRPCAFDKVQYPNHRLLAISW